MRAASRTIGMLIAVALLGPGCGSARRSEPIKGAATLDSRAERGRIVFMGYCHRCHPGGEGGLAPGINDKPVPNFVKKFQVRHGLGKMPSFSDEVISDADLDALIEYLSVMQDHDR